MRAESVMKKVIGVGISGILMASLMACGTNNTTKCLNDEIKTTAVAPKRNDDERYTTDALDFSVEFFRRSMSKDENRMVSPISAVTAVSIAENGAKGRTLKQMQRVCSHGFLLNRDLNEMQKNSNGHFSNANSIWVRQNDDSFKVNEEFLKKNASSFNAQIYSSDFKQDTVDSINHWVKKQSEGMIPKMIDKIDEDEVMHIINVVAFEDEWEETYESNSVRKGSFTNVDENVKMVDFLHSREKYYIDDKDATGFIKPYKNGFSFVALLPMRDISLQKYMDGMTGDRFSSLITNAKRINVDASIPKFKCEYSMDAKDILRKMGIVDAFDSSKADLSGLGTVKNGRLYIDHVYHKSYIEVNEKGTKASAATDVVVNEKATACMDTSPAVTLDRPFIYAIVDNNTNLPVFMGTVVKL